MTWYKDVAKGVYGEDGDDEQLAREEFVEANFAYAAIILGTTEHELLNAKPKPYEPAVRDA